MEKEYIVLGMMSGTSLDGLDLALCRFKKEDNEWQYDIISSTTIEYETDFKQRLGNAIQASGYELLKLDCDFGKLIALEIKLFLAKEKLQPTLIASHGQTIFHRPELGFTTQIGNGAVIAAETGITTVCDFRSLDVALGGQGAPLVPVGDEYLFGKYDLCLNLGGFSNISYKQNGIRKAFDISPCNLPLNLLAQQLGLTYDKDGAMARSGKVDKELLEQLDNLPFYQTQGPKSLGFEWLESHFLPHILNAEIAVEDKLCTVTEHIAGQIARIANPVSGSTLLITGGGANNRFLIERLSDLSNKQVIIPDRQTIEYKEALVFAFLGLLRMRGEINCFASVTGATQDSSCGAIIFTSPLTNAF